MIKMCECCGRPIGMSDLREDRLHAGLPVAMAATMLGVSTKTLYRWEETGKVPLVKAVQVAEYRRRLRKRR
jgi:predicted transcriptional regulator